MVTDPMQHAPQLCSSTAPVEPSSPKLSLTPVPSPLSFLQNIVGTPTTPILLALSPRKRSPPQGHLSPSSLGHQASTPTSPILLALSPRSLPPSPLGYNAKPHTAFGGRPKKAPPVKKPPQKKPPRMPPRKKPSTQTKSPPRTKVNTPRVQEVDQKDLPYDWTKGRTKDGTAFYFNSATSETRWEPPPLDGAWDPSKEKDGGASSWAAW